MSVFDDYDNYDKKLNLSEGIEHVRESEPEDKKKLEGYEPNPQDPEYYEVMGIKNSFDNVSVGADKYGQMLISVNTLKEPGEVTLDSDKKRMKSQRRKKKFGPYGDFYTNLFADRHGAFAFRADRNISDIRIAKSFEDMARKRVTRKQRDAMPMLRLEDDKAELEQLRGMSGSLNENFDQRRTLERRVEKETEYRNRFMARLRIARRKTYGKDEEEEEEQPDIFKALLSPEDEIGENDAGDEDAENGNELAEELMDGILDDTEEDLVEDLGENDGEL